MVQEAIWRGQCFTWPALSLSFCWGHSSKVKKTQALQIALKRKWETGRRRGGNLDILKKGGKGRRGEGKEGEGGVNGSSTALAVAMTVPDRQSGGGAVAASHKASLFTAALVVWGGTRTSKLSPHHTVHCACAHTYVLLCTWFICFIYLFLIPLFCFVFTFFGICFRFPFTSLESREICR